MCERVGDTDLLNTCQQHTLERIFGALVSSVLVVCTGMRKEGFYA